MGKDKESYEKNLEKFEEMSRSLDDERRHKKKKKKKDRKRSPSPEKELEVSPPKRVKRKAQGARTGTRAGSRIARKEETAAPPVEPVRITADDVASMAKEAEKEELKKDIVNMGQYTGATLEGGEARLNKFARLLGGKKKESKVNGEALNNRLEEQFNRARSFHHGFGQGGYGYGRSFQQ
ncbi:Oidioi.mRNA.OKI2018_I69.XSR.g13352.t1.cds [Oikopleura dioica]|uniref:Oidioi.mRNA.OKI2018_I69.XSR.g13352.t1.cds n=1 Tax=Oikopleura dioica TaxID=34765 RepID=A0ABN7S741_OIKDI|nr:Oidioi.mRNA.OKI2018_I69.XSR.g13352.t1.cds [Oikopleura dioica]